MPTTTTLISAQTLTSTASTVSFSSIPQTFTDLKVVYSARNTDTQAALYIRPNGSTSNLSAIRLMADGTTVSSGTSGSTIYVFSLNDSTTTSNSYSNTEFYISNYASTTVAKSISIDGTSETNASPGAGAFRYLGAGLWNNTTAISSITLVPEATGIFAIGSSFYLYGVSSDTSNQIASGPYAFGGDVVTTDGSYWYHAFTGSNSFTPLKNLTANILVIGGGGGGASGGGSNGTAGGGGGAGGVFYATTQSLTSGTVYPAVVGAGGAGATRFVSYVYGNKGGDSKFGTLTSGLGGGGGAGFLGYYSANNDGGSGGGGGSGCCGGNGLSNGGSSTQTGTGGTGYGNAGAANSGQNAGGGGGAGAAGSGRSGGAGLNTWSSWATATNTGVSGYYAGGGGGGADSGGASSGGSGGGGSGGAQSYTTAGAFATGSGGGGGSTLYQYSSGGQDGSNGGSGIVIIRYAV